MVIRHGLVVTGTAPASGLFQRRFSEPFLHLVGSNSASNLRCCGVGVFPCENSGRNNQVFGCEYLDMVFDSHPSVSWTASPTERGSIGKTLFQKKNTTLAKTRMRLFPLTTHRMKAGQQFSAANHWSRLQFDQKSLHQGPAACHHL